MEIYRLLEEKADFDNEIENCDSETHRKRIRMWLDGVAAGQEQKSLRAFMSE